MKVKVENNINEATTWLMRQSKKMPSITAAALNETAEKVKKAHRVQARKLLDRPTKYTLNGFKFFKATTRYQNVKFFIPAIQAKYMWYQIEGGTVQNVAVPVMANVKAENRINAKTGNIKGKRTGLLKTKGDFFGRGKGGRTNIYRTKGKVGHKTTTTQFVIKDQTYRPKFPYYKIGFGVINNTFDKILTKEWNKLITVK